MKTEASFFPRSPYMAAEPVSKYPSVAFYFYEGLEDCIPPLVAPITTRW